MDLGMVIKQDLEGDCHAMFEGTVPEFQETGSFPFQTGFHLYKVHHLKRNQQARSTAQKCDQKQSHPPVTLESRSPCLLGRCSRSYEKTVRVRTWYIYEQNVFILEHFFASEAFAH
jgi:hypothetical protein